MKKLIITLLAIIGVQTSQFALAETDLSATQEERRSAHEARRAAFEGLSDEEKQAKRLERRQQRSNASPGSRETGNRGARDRRANGSGAGRTSSSN